MADNEEDQVADDIIRRHLQGRTKTQVNKITTAIRKRLGDTSDKMEANAKATRNVMPLIEFKLGKATPF
jgi:phage terminase small subunit